MEWVRKFTALMGAVARAAGIALEMLYVGKSNPKEKVRRSISTITVEKLSHTLPDRSVSWKVS